jgi:peroxiredoxin
MIKDNSSNSKKSLRAGFVMLALTFYLTCFQWPARAVCCNGNADVASTFPEFELQTTNADVANNEHVSLGIPLDDAANATSDTQLTVICFLGTECPLAKLYAARLVKLESNYRADNVRFLGIFPNVQDSPDDLLKFADAYDIKFPIGKDDDQRLADALAVKRTPEVFLVANSDLQILYRGRIDDQYSPGITRNAPARDDLRLAIDQTLAKKPVAIAQTDPEGCLIGRSRKNIAQNPTVTWANQVSKIVAKNCLECHRSGEIGPFSMEQYDEVVGWAEMMMETIHEKRMPPWHADPDVGQFLNKRQMSQSEIDTLEQWIDQGMPFGDREQLMPMPQAVVGWNLPKEPDLVVPMSGTPFSVPAEGVVEYQYFVVNPEFETDRWISAVEVRPGNRSVVHHSIVFIRPPDGTAPTGVGWLGAYVPGQRALKFKANRARFVPAGSRLVFQQHYTTTGKAEQDLTDVGIVYADEEEIDTELITVMAINQSFEIEPHEPSHRVTASLSGFGEGRNLISVSPHMHYRGKSFKAWINRAETGDSDQSPRELMISVPRYDFNWQHAYQFSEKQSLDDVTSIEVEVEFDNSAANPFNPDPTAWVMWGDQTFEEMAVAFFDVERPRKSATTSPSNANQSTSPDNLTIDSLNDKQRKRLDQFVDKYFERFDKDLDGQVVANELPRIKKFEPNRYDQNKDGSISPEELANAIWHRFSR